MLKQIYVVDFVVDDLAAAQTDFDRLFGTEPLLFEPKMAPGAHLNAVYYQMPGEGAGIHAVGVFDRSGDGPKDAPLGAILVGILCDDVDRTIDDLRAGGIGFHYPEQRAYAVGKNNLTEDLNGVTYAIAQHEEGGYRRGQEMMRTRHGSKDFGDPTQGGLLKQFYVFDIVVRDLEAATENYRTLFGVEPIDTSSINDANGEIRSVHFPAPGEGAGIHSVGLFALTTDKPKSAAGQRLKQALEARGEGIFLIGFLVSDIDRLQSEMEARGFTFIEPKPKAYRMGRGNTIAGFHGVDIWFAQHEEDAYADYRAMEDS